MKDNRLFKMLYYILEKEKVTAKELADKFEVSLRTIYRDVDTLCDVGIPLYTTQGKGGGIEILPDFVLDKSLLTNEEKEQILASLQGLENTNKLYESELLKKLSGLFKIKNTNWIEVDFSSWQNSNNVFEELKEAILNKRIITFDYFSSKEEETKRCVKPIRLLFKGQGWYLYAYCLKREDFRYFKLNRIKNLVLTEDCYNDIFEDVVLKTEYKSDNLITLYLKFDKTVAFRVYDEITTPITQDAEGNLLCKLTIENDYNLYYYLFTFAESVEVLAPFSVRTEFKEKLEKMLNLYKT